jgi:hypothetical protein
MLKIALTLFRFVLQSIVSINLNVLTFFFIDWIDDSQLYLL